jgi:hypothetical protein
MIRGGFLSAEDRKHLAVLQRLAGAAPVFNPRYLDFARHHGFAIEACNVARGTTNRAYKHWSQIFNNDSTLTSAILDRVLHHADTVVIEGKSFRMKDEIEE